MVHAGVSLQISETWGCFVASRRSCSHLRRSNLPITKVAGLDLGSATFLLIGKCSVIVCSTILLTRCWAGRDMSLEFEWDEDKAKRNIKKHRVSFEEASSVFGDPLALTIPDPLHSKEEDRFIILGESHRRRLLV